MTEKQRILKNLSFETKVYDIYKPSFSSDSGSYRAKYPDLNMSSSNADSSLDGSDSSLASIIGNKFSVTSIHTDTEIERC